MAVEKKSIAKPEVKADAAVKAEPAKAAAKPAAKKAAAKKPAAKKTAAKKPATKKPAAAKAPAAKKADVSAKVVLQLGEREYTEAALVKIAQDVWKYDLGKGPPELKRLELYLKPEEKNVYHVMNDESGDFNI